MNEQYAGFDDYRARTTRDISVFVLEPRSLGGTIAMGIGHDAFGLTPRLA
jgi:hypothetical protein